MNTRRLRFALAFVLVIAPATALAELRPSPAAGRPLAKAGAAPPREVVLYGHVKSLTRKGGRFELRFDPAWWLGGVTAQRAAVEDGAVRPGEAVPNDYYVVEEGHRLLTFRVPASAHVTVVTRGRPSTAIPVSELAQIVRGRNPRHRPLLEPRAGFWIRVALDTVRSLDQQYQP